MSASPSARAFDALRPAIVVRLLELRSSLDPALARTDEVTARAQIDAVLGDFGEFLATADVEAHRAFLASFVAKRAAEEAGHSAALSTLTAIGDTAVQVVQEQVLGPTGDELALLVARLTTSSVRIVNDLIAEELIRRRARAHELRSGQRGLRTETSTDLRGGPAASVAPVDSAAPAARLARQASQRTSRHGAQVSGELTTHPGTDPSTDPGTDPGGMSEMSGIVVRSSTSPGQAGSGKNRAPRSSGASAAGKSSRKGGKSKGSR